MTDAVAQSYEQNLKNATLIFRFLQGLVEQRMSPKSLEGPIGIARLSGEAARAVAPYLISMMAAISLNLGIFNLLPIPVLFLILLLLFGFVMYNDILKILPSG